jgi:uncharacterized protein with beta-barrel porin domain
VGYGGYGIPTRSVDDQLPGRGDTTQQVDMSFASAPEGTELSVVSSDTSRDGILLNAGLDVAATADYISNAASAQIVHHFHKGSYHNGRDRIEAKAG